VEGSESSGKTRFGRKVLQSTKEKEKNGKRRKKESPSTLCHIGSPSPERIS